MNDSTKSEMTRDEIIDFVKRLNIDAEALKPMRFFYSPAGKNFGVFFNPDANAGMNLDTATPIMECASKAAAIAVVMTMNRALLDSIKQLTKKSAKYSKTIQ